MQQIPYASTQFDAFLFDMDGTVLTSIAATERVWGAWAHRHGLDVARFLPTIHGMRAIDTVRRAAIPGLDPVVEANAIAAAEIDDVEGVEPIAGAPAFIDTLPADRWAIVTSAPRDLAKARIAAAGLPMPRLLISGDDVENGKPAPDGFCMAAAQLGWNIENCLVLEDAPAGIQAGETAGASVLVITAGHEQPVETTQPTITDYLDISARQTTSGSLSLTSRR